jgi:cytochrome P450
MLMTKKFEAIPTPSVFNLFTGHLLQLRKERINFFMRQQKELGHFYRLKVPTRKVIVLTDPEWIKYVLVDNNKNYTKSFAYDSIRLFLGNGLLTSEGEFWKRQRQTGPACIP